jgi:hypothetical protein
MPDITLPNPQYCVFVKMMLFDPEVGPIIKGGVWQEGREGEERLMSATGKVELGNVSWRPEEGHLVPEVKTANEVTCDYVWDKPYPPISATCSKQYIRKAPFVLGAQPLDMSLLSRCWLA